MNDPQIWTLLGVFSAVMFAALGVSTRYTVSTLRAELKAVDAKHEGRSEALAAQIATVDHKVAARFDAVDARFLAVDARFLAVDARFDGLEKRLDTRIDGLEQRLDAKIDGLGARLDATTDHTAEVLGVRLDSVDHRLGAVEDDLKIVKAHLLRHPAA